MTRRRAIPDATGDADPGPSGAPEAAGRDRAALAARAAYVLRGNSAVAMTRAAPDLYPHQWSWDAAFVAVGLAHLDMARACLELDTLFAGQWRTGMLPHIVFDPAASGYFPGPDRWACAEHSADAPHVPQTSGICAPPVHALAVERMLEIDERRPRALASGRRSESIGTAAHRGTNVRLDAWLAAIYPRLLAWHRYLARHRDPDGTGLLTIYHGWESGMDNSPRWDDAYAQVVVGPELPPYARSDTTVLPDASQRPSQQEYDRYLWIVEELKRAQYDDAKIQASASFLSTDVFMSAIFAAANDALAALAERLGAREVDELRADAERFRRGVAASVNATTGCAVDTDLRTGVSMPSETIAGFAPLLCGGLDAAAEERLIDRFRSDAWTGHAALRQGVLPTTSPTSATFRPRTYWRGPSWPVMNWFFAWMLHRRGVTGLAGPLRQASIAQLGAGELAEYYQPLTGEPLGSEDQSWTAAAALDLLLAPGWPA